MEGLDTFRREGENAFFAVVTDERISCAADRYQGTLFHPLWIYLSERLKAGGKLSSEAVFQYDVVL